MNSIKELETKSKEPLVEMFSHLGRPCAVPLILALGERSYNADVKQLGKSFDKKLSKATISKCLADLAGLGLVEGIAQEHSGQDVEYGLTDRGQQIYRHLLQIRHVVDNASTISTERAESISAC